MREDFKIREAEYHLGRMPVTAGHEIFPYELSAFLSSARSVLQYALEEAKTKSGGQAWYDGEVCRDPLVKFLKEVRDDNIHVAPVAPTMDTTIPIPGGKIIASGAVPMRVIEETTGEFAFASIEILYDLVLPPGDALRAPTEPLGGHPKPAINRHLKTGN